MTTEIEKKVLHSVQDAADRLGVTVGRVRQILLSEHNDGEQLATKLGRDWVLTPKQLLALHRVQRKLFFKKYGRYPNEA